MLTPIHGQINLSISKVFWLVIRQQQNRAFLLLPSGMGEILPLLLIDKHFLVEVNPSHIGLFKDLALLTIEVHLSCILFVQLLTCKGPHLLQ